MDELHDLGAELYDALVRHELLDEYRKGGGQEAYSMSMCATFCVLEPRSLGGLARVAVLTGGGFVLYHSDKGTTAFLWLDVAYGASDEEAMARALLLTLARVDRCAASKEPQPFDSPEENDHA